VSTLKAINDEPGKLGYTPAGKGRRILLLQSGEAEGLAGPDGDRRGGKQPEPWWGWIVSFRPLTG
jgi:hypothetical protein